MYHKRKYTDEEKRFMKGGGDQPITRRQIFLIEKLANNLDSTAQMVALEKYDKNISELKGSEAHEIINILMEKQPK